MKAHFTVDLNEGRLAEVGCLYCNDTVEVALSPAYPPRAYVLSLNCQRCGRQLAEYDNFTYLVPPESFRPKGVPASPSPFEEVTTMAGQHGVAGHSPFGPDEDEERAVARNRHLQRRRR